LEPQGLGTATQKRKWSASVRDRLLLPIDSRRPAVTACRTPSGPKPLPHPRQDSEGSHYPRATTRPPSAWTAAPTRRACAAPRPRSRRACEYALSGMAKPMGVAEYQLVRALPEPLDTKLPSIEQLEKELSTTLADEA
jgi:hypothetical protein